MQRLILNIAFFILLFNLNAAYGVELHSELTELDPTAEVEYLEDKTGQLELNDIIAADYAPLFKPVSKRNKVINLDQSNSTFWLKVALKRTQGAKNDWVLDIPNTHLDEITFYGFNTLPIKTGSKLPFVTRPYSYRYFAFPITVDTQDHNYYLKVKSNYTLTIPMVVRTFESFYLNNQKTILIQAIYFGGTIIISLFSLFIFLSTKDRKFLYYSLFISFFGMAMFAKHGFARIFFWQDSMFFDGISQSFFSTLSGLFAILFSCMFLETKKLSVKIDALLRVLNLFFIVIAIALLLTIYIDIPSKPIFTLVFINSQIIAIAIVFTIYLFYRSGVKTNNFFLLAWVMFFTGITISNLRTFGLIPANNFTINSIQIFSALEIILWSVALINTFFDERKLKEHAQREAISAQNLLIEIQANNQAILELKVKERTHELEESVKNEQLMRAKQLRFNAIISHEFRNPLAIIESQATLVLKEQATINESLSNRIITIKSANRRLLSLFDKWIDNDRISVMRNELVLNEVKIYDLIESVFNKSKELYPEHQFELFTDNAHQQTITAHQDWLEIVIVNLLDNACKYSDVQSKIILQCYQENGHTCIAVIDQGIGIAPQNHEQIFNEYYRVNDTKKLFGLGLGLSLVKKIVDLHQATIEVVSSPNQGSTFRIILNNTGLYF